MKNCGAFTLRVPRQRAAPSRAARLPRGARPLRGAGPLRAALLAAVLAVSAAPVLAAGGSYASSGTGTFAQSLWWLDFTSFNTGSVAAQPLTFTLPNGAGTFNLSAQITSGMAVVAEPSWSGGGAFGHGAYNGITGKPIFYWLNQTGTGTTTLSGLTVKDASGNARTFVLYSADGENTNAPETITYTSTSSWSLIDNVTYYASFNGGAVTLSGTGTGIVLESAPTTTDGNYNGSVVLGTANPTQVSTAFSGNEAALFALSLPPLTFNLVINGRISASDQFTASIAYTSPAATIKAATTSGAGNVGTGATSVIGTNSITLSVAMAAGSFSALSAYTGSMSCTNSGPGASAFGGTNTVLPHGAGTSFTLTPQTGDAITCTLTLTPPPQTIAGTVYNDANHNGTLDGGESGTGVSGLFVKLAPFTGGVCQSPATAAAAVNAASGAYSFAPIAAGSYCLILNADSTLTDIIAARPAGWLGTQNPSGVIQLNVVPSEPPPPQNFGLYDGSSVSGVVFADTGAGAGIANNGVQDGAEAGIGSVLVQGSGAVTTAMRTPAAGTYTLWIPATASGTLTVTPLAPSGYLATGGSAGTSGGSYSRPSVSFTPVAGQAYTGVSFGLVPPNSLAPNGAQQAQPGATVQYAHTFIAGSAGQVSFAIAASSAPAAPPWTAVLYQDLSCSGTLSGSDPQISAPIAVTAGQKVCLIVKVQVPAGAAAGAQSAVTVSAACQYSNASPALAATVSASDLTTVGATGTLSLVKLVSNLTQGGGAATAVNANPGDTLQYTLTATNTGAQTVSTLVISDATPAFTTFVSAACPGTLPAGVSSCSVTTQPAAGGTGAVQWSFGGSLRSGGALTVTYQVRIGS
jgi:uncharacterized repeat protein (TIGR01451 family)